MKRSPDEIREMVARNLTGFTPVEPMQELRGGNLNHVWRLRGRKMSVIVKHAPPYIASKPDVPLNSNRIDFEARALRLFAPEQRLSGLADERVRPPKLLYHDPDSAILVMEDIGQKPGLDNGLYDLQEDGAAGRVLGRFIGRLHAETLASSRLREQFNNRPIQQSRFEVQYRPAADYAAGVMDQDIEETVGGYTRMLGEMLLKPGRCLVMGDLWPPSVLVDGTTLRLIDWEFVHFGQPLQDTAHFAAHCWMQAHTAPAAEKARQWKKLWSSFWRAYQQASGDRIRDLQDNEVKRNMAIHTGAEILVRAAGPFKAGYVYGDYEADHARIREAIRVAAGLITGSEDYAFPAFLPPVGRTSSP
ncbi:MAG: phosphotransferase [Balneolaceae bacterium]|nr:phosphotransferase [Balneolaceae bacterium]